MAYAVEARSKNSFITFVSEYESEEGNIDDALALWGSPRQPRSRSADSVRERPEAEELQCQAQKSLTRLTTAVNSGVLQPLPRAGKTRSCHSSPKLSWDNCRVQSTCSLSTMAPDDSSDYGEHVPLGPIGRPIRPVCSSGSICSMVSDWSIAEDAEVEFELDIDAAAAAARPCDKKTIEHEAEDERPAPTHGKITAEMSHGLVPKKQNMAEMYKAANGAPPTTLMIRNIPGKYTQNDLMMDLKDTGFGSKYDFLYLPIDKGTAANVGYAFVNFMDPAVAEKCIRSFEGHRFTRHQRSSTKLARISVAHLQGLEKNLQHYENCAVNASKEKRRRPVVVANISSMFD